MRLRKASTLESLLCRNSPLAKASRRARFSGENPGISACPSYWRSRQGPWFRWSRSSSFPVVRSRVSGFRPAQHAVQVLAEFIDIDFERAVQEAGLGGAELDALLHGPHHALVLGRRGRDHLADLFGEGGRILRLGHGMRREGHA